VTLQGWTCDKKPGESRSNVAGPCPNQDVVDKVCDFICHLRSHDLSLHPTRSAYGDVCSCFALIAAARTAGAPPSQAWSGEWLESVQLQQMWVSPFVGLPFLPVFLSPPPAAQTRAPVTRQLYARRKTQLDLVWESRSEQMVLTTRLPGPVPGVPGPIARTSRGSGPHAPRSGMADRLTPPESDVAPSVFNLGLLMMM
jgi:hypothetical protein